MPLCTLWHGPSQATCVTYNNASRCMQDLHMHGLLYISLTAVVIGCCCLVQVHAANKPIDRSNDDQLLHRVAELAVGYSGAELANLLNEAAILAVRTFSSAYQSFTLNRHSCSSMTLGDCADYKEAIWCKCNLRLFQ